MLIRNPYAGSEPVQCKALHADGRQSTLQQISRSLLTVDDDVVELLTVWPGRNPQSKVWTKAEGWLEISEYEVRKKFAAEKAEFERMKAAHKKRSRPAEPQLDVKVTPPDDQDDPTS